jgi:hypothetical protein
MPSLLRSLFAKPAPTLQLLRYRGTASGWQPIGGLRDRASAERLSAYVSRIHPEATLKLS